MFSLTNLLIFLFGCAAILLLIFFSFYCFFIMYDIIPPMRVPRPIKRSFGRETEFMEDQSIRPFKLVYCENEFEKIKNKIKMDLDSMGSLHPISSEEVFYGMNINYIKDVADYWVNKFDWQRHVNTLNFSRQFVTQISGLDIHFIHVKPPQVISASISAYPILLLHSFPTSAYEFSSLIPLLVTNNGSRIIFEVVAPTLPGHGWSEAASEAGLDGCQVGFIMHELMTRLGYTKYYIHGGGPGGLVAEQIAAIHPESVYGVHLTMPICDPFSIFFSYCLSCFPFLPQRKVSNEDIDLSKHIVSRLKKQKDERIFLDMCERIPDTLGISLSGSPLSLAVFYLEIFSSWTDPLLRKTYNGGLNRFPGGLDWLISNLMVYILSGSPVPSARFIFENRNLVLPNIQVPTAVAVYPKNPFPLPGGLPRAFLPRRLKNVVRYTRMDSGGYYPALENPRRLQTDIFAFVKQVQTKT